MGSEQNKELVHRLVNEAVTQKNLKALDEVAEGEIAQAALALSITTTAGLVSKHFRTTSELASDGGWIEVVKVNQEFVRMNDIDAIRFAGFGRKVF